ncbi:MAG TPA: ParA family protein [Ideonella sp.]|jgi:chromosome partitioning protein|nr:ParA family protein [Ideonella sp.]
MPVIAIANPKGGVGKSTLATNLAGALARQGQAVMLGDLDRQQSSRQWLQLRHSELPKITNWEVREETGQVRPPKGTSHVVIDTPAGMHGKKLSALLAVADIALVPLQPSLFDIQATHRFLAELREHPRAGKIRIGLVGMRVKDHTIAQERLQQYVSTLPAPMIATIRDTQNYVHLAAHGLTLWDVAPGRVERDLAQWQPLLAWVGGKAGGSA